MGRCWSKRESSYFPWVVPPFRIAGLEDSSRSPEIPVERIIRVIGKLNLGDVCGGACALNEFRAFFRHDHRVMHVAVAVITLQYITDIEIRYLGG